MDKKNSVITDKCFGQLTVCVVTILIHTNPHVVPEQVIWAHSLKLLVDSNVHKIRLKYLSTEDYFL